MRQSCRHGSAPPNLTLISPERVEIGPRHLTLSRESQPSYQILKWIVGGGFGQVYKVLRDGEVCI